MSRFEVDVAKGSQRCCDRKSPFQEWKSTFSGLEVDVFRVGRRLPPLKTSTSAPETATSFRNIVDFLSQRRLQIQTSTFKQSVDFQTKRRLPNETSTSKRYVDFQHLLLVARLLVLRGARGRRAAAGERRRHGVIRSRTARRADERSRAAVSGAEGRPLRAATRMRAASRESAERARARSAPHRREEPNKTTTTATARRHRRHDAHILGRRGERRRRVVGTLE